MARFPVREAEIESLAQNIGTRLTANPAEFPAPAVTGGDSTPVSVALESEATLNNRERGRNWEYRIIAVSKTGEGAPSDTAAAVV